MVLSSSYDGIYPTLNNLKFTIHGKGFDQICSELLDDEFNSVCSYVQPIRVIPVNNSRHFAATSQKP